MALSIFSDAYQSFTGKSLPELQATGAEAFRLRNSDTFTGAHVYGSLATSNVTGVIVVPGLSVAPYDGQSNENGVLTHLTFKPSGSIKGPAVTVEERVGSMAYFKPYAAAAIGLQKAGNAAAAQPGYSLTDYDYISDAIIQTSNLLKSSTIDSIDAVEKALDTDAQYLKANGYANVATYASKEAAIAAEWETPLYFMGMGAQLRQVSGLSLAFGIDLKQVGGLDATWAVKGATGGVSVSGYTAVASGSTQGQFVFDIHKASTSGQLDIAGQAPDPAPATIGKITGVPSGSNLQTVALAGGTELLEVTSGGQEIVTVDGTTISSSGTQTVYANRAAISAAALTNGSVVEVYVNNSADRPNIAYSVMLPSGQTLSSGSISAVSTSETGAAPEVIALRNGGFAVAWYDSLKTGSATYNDTLKLQMFGANGQPASGQISLGNVTVAGLDGANGSAKPPGLTQLSNGNIAISWNDQQARSATDYSSSADVVLHTSIVGATGSVLTSFNAAIAASDEATPAVSQLANGNFAVVWNGLPSQTSFPGIYAQLFTSGGGSLGTVQINTAQTTPGSASQPQLAALSNGDFVVSWGDNAQLVSASGALLGSSIRFPPAGSTSLGSTLAALPNGRFEIQWQDAQVRASGLLVGDGIDYQIYDTSSGTAKPAAAASMASLHSMVQAMSTMTASSSAAMTPTAAAAPAEHHLAASHG